MPTFLKSRIWIDFSSPEAVNENWERLIRTLFGKPLHEKPELGKPPAYIREETTSPASPAIAKYNALRQAILQNKKGITTYRQDFLDACIEYADALRVRERPEIGSFGERVLEDCGKLKHVRNHIVDWVLIESASSQDQGFDDSLLELLERLLELKSRPPELNSWNDSWFDAHEFFAYETFLYIIAALLKTNALLVLHTVFNSHYLLPETERYREDLFVRFDRFYGTADSLQLVLAPEGKRLFSPAAELTKRQADRTDIPFKSILEAELLILLMALITPDTRWYPQTLYYTRETRQFPLFLRASQHKHFIKLAIITGIDNADVLRESAKNGYSRLGIDQWHNFHFIDSFWRVLNMDKLDTIR